MITINGIIMHVYNNNQFRSSGGIGRAENYSYDRGVAKNGLAGAACHAGLTHGCREDADT